MRYSICLLFVIVGATCNAQASLDKFDVNHGIDIEQLDTSITKYVQLVHFAHATGVVFPATFTKVKLKETHFTLDTNLLKNIDKVIVEQYCIAWKRFNDSSWNENIELLKLNGGSRELKAAQRQHKEQNKNADRWCAKWQKELPYYDKQYLGYTNDLGEKIIYIQLLDFRKDPYHLKNSFYISWINGWHGWFETNTKSLHFHIDKNLLTINENY